MFEETHEALTTLGAAITTNEIKQQPKLWTEVFDYYRQNERRITQFLKKIEQETQQKIRVIFTGAGTSQYVGDTIVPYLNQKGKRDAFTFESIGTTDIVAAPLDYLVFDEVTILVSFARSGNSPESVAAIELANQLIKTVFHITITCSPDGLLAQAAQNDDKNLLLLMPAKSNDKGFAMTGSFTCMTLMGLLVFDLTATEIKERYINAIKNMGQEVIQQEATILAMLGNNYKRIIYLGSGSLAGLTREAQLKVLELTAGKIATIFDSSLGFRHGPKSFINQETLVFVFISNNPYTRQYDVDILNEINEDNIAAAVVGIGQAAQENNFSGAHFTFSEGKVILPEAYLALPDVVFAQTVALNSSVHVGNTPDTPSPTGTVNRVVQGVNIYPYLDSTT